MTQPESESQPATEQIGDLVYLPNPDYPYQLPTVTPPHFWMTEQTGKLSDAMEEYYSGESLSRQSLDLIKQYLRQYLERVVMAGEANRNKLITQMQKVRTNRELENFAEEIAEYGVEPF